ncbi:M1 family aminopeptidase [Flavobacterium sp. MK4S-17]|uniref:M1 family aminopeptidase n=1 Tax=Flavobacterium sp. MK4S-17 TaxID=2543737 RepID=UPI001359E04A|nr:M1 family aminopeptidase [Flavobacterium sp. MK4S-17]
MKPIYIIISLFCSLTFLYAQQEQDFNRIVEAEMKSGYRLKNFTANENTGNYDVNYHNLAINVNPAVQFVSGVVTTTFTAKENMATITFDLSNQLTVSAVTQNSTQLNFEQNNNDELVITFPSVLPQGAQSTVTITYSGAPPTEQEAFVTSAHNGTPVLWTLSEPYGAKDWWPCKQDLIDKIESIDVRITAPQQYISVANGMEQSQTINSNGTKTTHFHHGYPIPAYLVAIAVTNYSIYNQTAGTAPNTFPIVNYLYPENFTQAQNLLGVTLPIMSLFEELFETYPFHTEKYGHAQYGFGGGMEHTTVSFMGNFSRELIAHELAHQWFGDKVTCGSWKDIWLNEGFATYLSGLVVEHLDGNLSFNQWKSGKINNITAFPNGNLYLTDADTTSINRIFSSRLSYNKGAMVLHMLRFKVGNENFYQGIKNYLADENLAYGYAKTPDLEAHLEAASGMDLTEFFLDWVYRQGYPSYTVTAQNWGAGQVKITVGQTQSHSSVSYFEMPLPIRLIGTGGQQQNIIVDNTYNGQEFIVNVPFNIISVQFDPERNIISANNSATLGVKDYEGNEPIKLFPNPSKNQLNITLPDGLAVQKATFYNTAGQKVLESGNTNQWNIASLSAGEYFITLLTNRGNKYLKFIKG